MPALVDVLTKLLLAFLLFLAFSSCTAIKNLEWEEYGHDNSYSYDSYSYDRDAVRPNEPGMCYARCLIQGEYVTQDEYYLEYIGDNPKQKGIKRKNIELSPATTKWVKKKADKNCLSADPNDCLVWCLEETPAEIETVYIVTDTTLIKDYHEIELPVQRLESVGGFTEWREVLCETAPGYSNLVKRVQIALNEKGYNVGIPDNKNGPKTKAALIKYQKTNNLPIGQLDVDTLKALGVM